MFDPNLPVPEQGKPGKELEGREGRSVARGGRRKKRRSEIEAYIESKKCEICLLQDNEDRLMLCDRCDDSYHTYCLLPALESLPEQEWICMICRQQLQQLAAREEKLRRSQVLEKNCHKCQLPLDKPHTIKGLNREGEKIEVEIARLGVLQCLYCKHTFHTPCFSDRKNSLNCRPCEREIRKKGPKSHDDFMRFIYDCVKSIKQEDCKFAPLMSLENDEEIERYHCFRLKVPSYMTTWQSIVQNEASIYYAFKTKGLTFIDDQLYEKDSYDLMMHLNDPRKDINGPILRLHPRDERVYEEFKINSEKGYVGPFEVREDRVKGFYLIATEYIEPLTIVSEYLGEVKTARIAVNFEENDSIFLLVRSARSCQSLDIVPQLYGNISRFFLGINNEYKRLHGASKLQNVKSLRFSYRGRVRLLLYTSKPIQFGETLYFNYNGSAFHEYPTDQFVV